MVNEIKKIEKKCDLPINIDKSGPRLSRRVFGWVGNALVFVAAFFALHSWQTRDMLAEDSPVAPFTTVLLSGQPARVAADPERPTLIYFFAPWCSICRASIGNLRAIDSEQTQVIVIALDYESVESVQAFVADTGVDAPVHLGTAELRERFRIRGYPSYYTLDSEFRITGRSVGYSTALGLQVRAGQ